MTLQMPFQVPSSQAFSRVLPEASYQLLPTVALPTVVPTSQSSSQVLALDGESGIAEPEAQPQMLVELDELGEYIEVSSGNLAGRLYLEKFELSEEKERSELCPC